MNTQKMRFYSVPSPKALAKSPSGLNDRISRPIDFATLPSGIASNPLDHTVVTEPEELVAQNAVVLGVRFDATGRLPPPMSVEKAT